MLLLSKEDLQLIIELLDAEIAYADTPLSGNAKKHQKWVTKLRDNLKRQQ